MRSDPAFALALNSDNETICPDCVAATSPRNGYCRRCRGTGVLLKQQVKTQCGGTETILRPYPVVKRQNHEQH